MMPRAKRALNHGRPNGGIVGTNGCKEPAKSSVSHHFGGQPAIDGVLFTRLAVPSVAGHFCINEFKAESPVPVIDLLEVVKREVSRRAFKKVGLLGTRVVMETRFYGALGDVEVI